MFLHGIHLPAGKRYIYYLQLFFETLAKLVTANLYFVQSIFLFIKNYNGVQKSRKQLLKREEGKKHLSVKEVANFIQSSVKNKKIRFFSLLLLNSKIFEEIIRLF